MTWRSPHFITLRVFYVAGGWQEDTLPPCHTPWQRQSSDRFVRQGAPYQSVGTFYSAPALLCLWRCSAALTQCWSYPGKATNPPFPPGTVCVEAATRHCDLGPGLEPPTAATSKEQGVATNPRASPLVTKQHGAWYGPIASLHPYRSFS